MNSLDAALELAERGIPCFPCHPDKTPLTPNGYKDATADPGQLRRLFRPLIRPWALIGVPTGARTGLAVLDIDPRHDGDKWLLEHFDELPPTRVHKTGGGGYHLLFRHREGLCTAPARIAPGVDVRGEAGFVRLVAGGGAGSV